MPFDSRDAAGAEVPGVARAMHQVLQGPQRPGEAVSRGVFESGEGCVLVDVDGNRYIDFSSGIYVTTLGHCHPKVSEAVAKYAGQLMNAHDFTTPIKTLLVEKLAEVLPGDFGGFQFYDAGTAAVEAGMRVLRAATGHNEMLSCFNDFHGKTYGAVSLAQIRSPVYGRVRMPGAHMVPRPDAYRPLWTKPDGTIDTDQYIAFYDEYIQKGTVGDVAGFVLEPIQGWAGSVMPPDDFFPKLRKFCDEKQLLLMADEVLTSWGRTGKWLCMEHWGVVPDVVSIGKGFGNGFPGDVRCRARAVQGEFREDLGLEQLRRQPDGLRGGAGLDRSDRGGEPAGARPAPRRARPEADGADEGRASDRRRRARQGLPDGHRAGQGPGRRRRRSTRRASWSIRRRSARAWPGFPPATSCG